MIQTCAVFCGSRPGNHPAYLETASELGRELSSHNITLIYGGGQTGLMGAVADAVLAHHGKVKGIIPLFLKDKEVIHKGVTDLTITEDMPSRKHLLFDWAESYLVLPGGFGTFDEFSEVLVNRQIGLHQKPIIILNVANWAKDLIATLDAAIEQGLADNDAHKHYHVTTNIEETITLLRKF